MTSCAVRRAASGVKRHDVGEKDRDGGVVVRDRPLTGAQARGDRLGQHVEDQTLGPSHLLGQPLALLLDYDVLDEQPSAVALQDAQPQAAAMKSSRSSARTSRSG